MKMHLGELLVDSGIITVKTLERALARQHGSGKRLGIVLDEMGVISQEELIEALAKQFGFATLRGATTYSAPERELLELIPEQVALEKLVFPLKRENGELYLAISDPFDTDTIDFLEAKTSLRIVPVLATREDILDAVKQHYLAEAARNSTQKILVLDDSSDVTSVIGGALRKEGYEVVAANDGVEGLRIAFSQKPDLILCDANMPRMDGYALMRAIKANPATAGIPMILLTPKASPEEEHRALKSGFHDFIAKPMMTIRVVARVKRAFEIREQGRPEPAAPAP